MGYSAFISYNHKDRKWANWLHRSLERYTIPKALQGARSPIGVLGTKLPHVFQDREELAASGDLAQSVRTALEQSATLIVICSPNSARSKWVNEEIRLFVSLGRQGRIFLLIVDGEPGARGNSGELDDVNCFPPALFESNPGEPLAADARPEADGKKVALLKLLAGILGVPFDDLRQREISRRQRRLAIIAAGSAIGLVLATGLAIFALISRNEAIRQRDIAHQKTMTAERTVSFVKSLFEVADPSESKGQTITAREILDRGARRIENSLQDEPSVKAELATTLGEVYLGLGLYHEGERLIRSSMHLAGRGRAVAARQFAALGDAQVKQGDYDAAVRGYLAALRLASASDGREDLVPRILNGLGESYSSNGDYKRAEKAGRAALKLDLTHLGSNHPDVARDLETLALNAFFDERPASARPLLERALSIRVRSQGQQHPKVSEDLNMLGSIAYLQGDGKSAEAYYRRVLAADEAVLGPDHPDLAITLNNLARVLLERREFGEAAVLLQRSIKITLAQRDATNDDLAFSYDNLAITQREMNKPQDAEVAFREALRIARIHNHRNLGPIMTDLADLLCERGDMDGGLALVSEAGPLVKKDYPDDPWRAAWTDNVRGGCLLKAGSRSEAEKLLASSYKILQMRWNRDSLYGYRALRRLRSAKADFGTVRPTG